MTRSGKLFKILLQVIISQLFYCHSLAAQEKDLSGSIVGIYAQIPPSKDAQLGTGFFVAPSGHILTAYHVIEGANHISIYGAGLIGNEPVRILAISAKYDLAELIISGYTNNITPILSYDAPILSSLVGEIIAWPRGMPDWHVPAPIANYKGRKSDTFTDSKGNRLFKESIDLIAFNCQSIYDGMSGGPLIVKNKVIGVVSGSEREGGTMAWAIPIVYRREMSLLNGVNGLPASQMKNWPPLSLMAGTVKWRNLRAWYTPSSLNAEKLETFQNTIASERQALQKLYPATRRMLVEDSIFLQKRNAEIEVIQQSHPTQKLISQLTGERYGISQAFGLLVPPYIAFTEEASNVTENWQSLYNEVQSSLSEDKLRRSDADSVQILLNLVGAQLMETSEFVKKAKVLSANAVVALNISDSLRNRNSAQEESVLLNSPQLTMQALQAEIQEVQARRLWLQYTIYQFFPQYQKLLESFGELFERVKFRPKSSH